MLPFELLAVQPRIGFLVSGSFIFVLSQEPNGGKLQWGLVLLGDTANHGACLKDGPLQRYQSRVPGQQQQHFPCFHLQRPVVLLPLHVSGNRRESG